MANWSINPIFNSLFVVFALSATMFVLLIVGPRFHGVGFRRRTILIALRVVVILFIVLAMLRPSRTSTISQPQSAVLILLFDQSRSMQLPNTAGQETRWQAQIDSLKNAEPFLSQIAEDLEIRVYAYDSQLHTIDFDGKQIRVPKGPIGEQTDIGSTLHEALQKELGQRLAGVILLGDGAQTAFEPKVETHEAGRELARLEYPLYTIVFGPAGDAAQSRDISVENLPEQYTVFVKNEVSVKSWVRVSGFVNKEIPVEMRVVDPQGKEERLPPQTVSAVKDGEQIPVQFSYVPQKEGQYRINVRAVVQSGELVTKNNELNAYLTVLEGGLRILFLEGELRQEQIFLRRSINASPDMQLDFKWIDRRARDQWPVDLSSVIEGQDYDVFMIGDLDSKAFREEDQRALVDAVDRGKGFVMLGGYHSFGAGGYRTTPLADLLPIVIDRFERQDFDAPIRKDLHVEGPLTMVPTRPHPITTLAVPDRNTDVWRSLKPQKGANKFAEIKNAAGVQVLAESADGEPLLISGEYGKGRVLAFGCDSTWQWWRQGKANEHKRFWRQMILWLAQREESRQQDVWIKMPQRRFNPGARIVFESGVRGRDGETIRNAKLEAKLISADNSSEPIRLTSATEGMTGTLRRTQVPGDYAIVVEASSPDAPLGEARVEFQILDFDIELSNPAADPDQFARLAAMTKEAGGRMIAPEELPALLEEIKERPPELEIEVQTKWEFADNDFDAWLFLLCLAGVLGSEWALRKHWGMV